MCLLDNIKNPLVILLTALGVLSYVTGDMRATVVIFVMAALGVVLRFYTLNGAKFNFSIWVNSGTSGGES